MECGFEPEREVQQCLNPLIHSTASDCHFLCIIGKLLSNLISQEKNLSGDEINGRAGIFFLSILSHV